jgi:hypothetical protein
VVSLAPLLLMLSLHLLGGQGETCSPHGAREASEAVTCGTHSCAHSAVATSAIETAHPEHEPVFAFELKNESSDQDDETRTLGSNDAEDDELPSASRSKTRHALAHDLLAGIDRVCAHAPRGPPLA